MTLDVLQHNHVCGVNVLRQLQSVCPAIIVTMGHRLPYRFKALIRAGSVVELVSARPCFSFR